MRAFYQKVSEYSHAAAISNGLRPTEVANLIFDTIGNRPCLILHLESTRSLP